MIPRCHAIVKKDRAGNVMVIFAVCMDRDAAQKCADNANDWYGEDHPLTPLVVVGQDVLFEPPPFPTAARLAAKKAAKDDAMNYLQSLVDAAGERD